MMKINSILFAARAKGPFALLKRTGDITRRYGFTSTKMDQALHLFVQTLGHFNCGASFPITTVVLKRNKHVISKYLDKNIEFLAHGYTHIDYSKLAPEQQLIHLSQARKKFAELGLPATGFRSPYLRREANLYQAIEAAGFSYVSNQPIIWDVLDAAMFTPTTYGNYQRALDFYEPWLASQQPSLPQFRNQLIEIPVSLPDDEILLDRLQGEGADLVKQTWQRILSQTYQRGELFTLQLHPERTAGCLEGLKAILAEARALTPAVWIARMDEIAAWWRARAKVKVQITPTPEGKVRVAVDSLEGIALLVRAVEVDVPTSPWADGYQQVKGTTCAIHSPLRPFIGLSPESSPQLADFLRQQGYLVEVSIENHRYAYYFDQNQFGPADELPLLTQIEKTDRPLVRLGRWPNGARAALSITGDIDAFTLGEYGLRFWGK